MSYRRRCAIYTRKSTEEGLDQDFNSLRAQREACSAYVASQASEHWTTVRTHYDDGGFSGGTMGRPALQRLLADIDQGKIDIVVVYKVDRLTRSLSDFARIVDILDARNVSFVSVTQQFNTTSSMGRLTLNVLLSFAQFEREVTAERIRDKIAASKKKGMWMGGPLPLGYDVQDRKLVVNKTEAKTVQTLFGLYRELGTVRRLKDEADRRGIVTKRRRQQTGKQTGGKPFARGNLYQLLSNPLYIGRIPHKGETFEGQHAAIIDQKTWTTVQNQLNRNASRRFSPTNTNTPSLLTGLVFDETGDRLCPTHTSKNGQRYRYYISKRLMHDARKHDEGWRLPATALEDAVCIPIRGLLSNQRRLIDALCMSDPRPSSIVQLERQGRDIASELAGNDLTRQREILRTTVRQVELATSSIKILLTRSGLAKLLGVGVTQTGNVPDEVITLTAPIQIRRRGVEAKLVIADAGTTGSRGDRRLCRLVAQAHCWFTQLLSGEMPSVRAIARRDGIPECDVSRNLRLAILAPDIVEAILDGQQPVELTAETLRRLPQLPNDWDAQRRLLGCAPR